MFNYFLYMIMNLFLIFINSLVILMGVAFLTLLERKVLGLIQYRKGPNKVGMMGIFQPFSDAVKLLSKELIFVSKSNYLIYYWSPMISFLLMLMIWFTFPMFTNMYYMNFSILMMIIMMSLMSYSFLLMGWSSNSVYSMLGSLRLVSQVLSYEISLILIFFIMMLMSEGYSLMNLINWQSCQNYFYLMNPLFLLFFFSCLTELNRSPVDFAEGESELVSGFNVEYFGSIFVLIFLSEYGMLMFFSLLMVNMFFGNFFCSFFMFMFFLFFLLIIIFMRGVLPRMRYDELMYFCWKIILPFILGFMIYLISIKCMMMLIN